MKISIDTKKGKETLSKVLQKTSNVSKKAVADIQQSAKEFSEKQKQEAYQKRLKKYNPLFPDTYRSESFNIPNLIMIRDDAERRDVDADHMETNLVHNLRNNRIHLTGHDT